MVPGSTLMYGSNFWLATLRPRALSRRPTEAAVMPLPSPETTPPVTKICLAISLIPSWRLSSPTARDGGRDPPGARPPGDARRARRRRCRLARDLVGPGSRPFDTCLLYTSDAADEE